MQDSLQNTYPQLYVERSISVPANSSLTMSLYGRFFAILVNDADDILVSFNDQEETILKTGIGIEIAQNVITTKAVFRNDTGTAKAITYAVADERFSDFRNTIAGTVKTEEQSPDDSDTDNAGSNVTTTATLILAARATRKSFLIQNLDSATDLYFIGTDNTKAANQGIKIPKDGGILTGTANGALYGITTSGTITSTDIRISEEY